MIIPTARTIAGVLRFLGRILFIAFIGELQKYRQSSAEFQYFISNPKDVSIVPSFTIGACDWEGVEVLHSGPGDSAGGLRDDEVPSFGDCCSTNPRLSGAWLLL